MVHIIRSNSLPPSIHPTILRIREELSKLKSFESSPSSLEAEAILIALGSLNNVYACVNDLLRLLLTQQALYQCRQDKWVDEMLNGSVQLMDLCYLARDALSSMKEHMQVLQSTLRRRRVGDPTMKCEFRSYFLYRKKAEKDINKSLSTLKKIGNGCASYHVLDENIDSSMVFGVFREVNVATVSIFKSVLCFMSSTSTLSKPSKWSLVVKVMRKGTVACEGEDGGVNVVERVDALLSALCGHNSSKDDDGDVKVQQAQKQMGVLEDRAEQIDGGLGCLFRHLIQIRVALLNNISL
ncbi:hypothetical protein QJS10_CPB15g00277 [Acorus calamus]|uniref:Uncharacterized protein n=1 Tax=Acorus calamus TaxID=4465 RepID=A0AAV9D5K0_ACOCL|nr:hypothetical protein QJS10_CPB15g00277 [Acorus calamus]